MALIPICDKCRRQGQVIQVLGKDLCTSRCVPQLREWLEYKTETHRNTRGERLAHAEQCIAKHGYVDAPMIAKITREPTATVNEALRVLAARGKLQRIGRGRYALPVQEAAE